MIRIPVKHISIIGRATKGVTLMRLNEEDKVTSVAVVEREEDEGEEMEGEGENGEPEGDSELPSVENQSDGDEADGESGDDGEPEPENGSGDEK